MLIESLVKSTVELQGFHVVAVTYTRSPTRSGARSRSPLPTALRAM